VQPGVASVYCAVVQQTHDGSEFYIKDFPELAGTCYADARRRFNSATLCAQNCPGFFPKRQTELSSLTNFL